MSEVDRLKVKIEADASDYGKGVDSAISKTKELKATAGSTGNDIKSAFSDLGKSLMSKVSFVAIAAGLVSFSKAAITAASDLQEVQNVVDVAFGDAATEINQFASTAITQLGMSELSAKQFSSTFMAMGNGMGVATKQGKEMAIELTKLTGDMASFYNVEQSVAQTALKSVYTGETESLKKFGVVMTEANLQAFALSQGITKQYKNMSQAEKVALRYNYVMSTTANAQGDFARTSDSWANQTRILAEQWNQFKGIVGQGLIQALTPLIKVFNQVLSAAISAGNAIAKVFGGKTVTASSQAASGYTEAAGAAEGYSEAMDDATGSAKKLNSASTSIDELNVLNDNSSGSGSSGGGGGTTFDTTETDSAIESTEDKLEGFAEKLKAYGDQIKGIFDKWFKDMPKLEFNFDKEKALEDLKGIGLDLANIIAGWTSFAVDISIKVANDLDIGRLANDSLKATKSLTGLASKITDVVVPALKKFYDIGLSPIVKWIGGKLSDGLNFLAEQLDELTTWVDETSEGFSAWAEVIGRVVAAVWSLISPILDVAWETFKNIIATIVDWFKIWWGFALDLGPVILDLMNGDTTKAAEDFNIAIGNLVSRFGDLFETVGQSPIAQMFADAWASISETWQNVAQWFQDNVITPLVEFFTPIFTTIGAIFEGLWMIIRAIWSIVAGWFNETVIQPLVTFFKPIVEKVGGFFKQLWEDIKTVWNTVIGWFNENIIEPLKVIFEPIVEAIGGIFDRLWEGIKDGVKAAMNFVIDKIEGALNGIIDMINGLLDGFADLVEWAGDVLDEDWSGIGRISHVSFPRFANGGLPSTGQVFVAREAGPELVGNIGNQSAVVNNQQILDGITSGVYEAVVAAMSQFQGNGNQPVQVYLDGKQLETSSRTTRQRYGATIATGGILNYA